MKKKSICIMLMCVVAFVCCFSGCSVKQDLKQNNVFYETPVDIVCGEQTVALQSVSFAQVYASHGYTGYVIVAFDRSTLTDDDIYWLIDRVKLSEDPQLSAEAYIDNDTTDSERLSLLGKVYDEQNIYFVLWSDVHQHEFEDEEIWVQIISEPDRKLTAESTQYYYYVLQLDPDADYSHELLSEAEENALQHVINAALQQ